MKKAILGLAGVALVATMVSCGNKKGTTKSGVDYEFFKGSAGTTLQEGDIVELDYNLKVGDSLLNSSAKQSAMSGLPVEFVLPENDSANYFGAPVPLDGLYMMKANDSAVFKIPAPKFFEKVGQPKPEWIKDTDFISWEVKVIKVSAAKELTDKRSALRKINADFVKLDNGLEYKFETLGESDRATQFNDFIEFHVVQRIGDSVLGGTRLQPGGQPAQQQITRQPQKFDLSEGLAMLRTGDKAIFRIPMKEIFAENPNQPKPEWINENDYLVFEIEAINVKPGKEFKKEQEEKQAKAQAEMETQSQAAGAANAKEIEAHLASKNITNFQKTASGLYYVVHKEGSGNKAEKGQKVSVNYTGKLLNGTEFDSNTNPKFKHVEPFEVPVGQSMVIKGWDEGLLLFNKGTKVTLYIPSNLGYGPQGAGENIPPNSVLVFDMEILDIK